MGYFLGFDGRFKRIDWWLAQLVMVAVLALTFQWLGLPLSFRTLAPKSLTAAFHQHGWSLAGPMLACFWIGLTAAAKRFHDRDKSAWWCLIAFVPYVGAFWQLIECGFLPGTPGQNAYGEDAAVRAARGNDPDDYDLAGARLARVAARTPQPISADPPLAAPAPAPQPPIFGRRGG